MKSLVIHAAKDLRVEEMPEPEPGADELKIAIARGGICGSDLHYYQDGGFGTVRVRQPMILGHEVSGYVEKIGKNVTGFKLGDLVAISPSRPDWDDIYSREGMPHHSLGMRFYGSAMPFPHVQGAFSEHIVATPDQCVVANGLTAEIAAMAEPLSVVLHALAQAGDILGRRVLVTGCGPIGVLSILALRRAGAAEIIAIDITDKALDHANSAGADKTINSATQTDELEKYHADKGYFHILIECSGAEPALLGAIAAIRPRGIMVQVGIGTDMNLPMNVIVAKELQLRGSFRFHQEFPRAVEMMQKGLIDVAALITHTMPLSEAVAAFELAGNREQAMKVQLRFRAFPG